MVQQLCQEVQTAVCLPICNACYAIADAGQVFLARAQSRLQSIQEQCCSAHVCLCTEVLASIMPQGVLKHALWLATIHCESITWSPVVWPCWAVKVAA